MENPSIRHFVSIAVPRPLDRLFAYGVPAEYLDRVTVGNWVEIPFGRSKTHGFVTEAPRPVEDLPDGLVASKLKSILSVGETGAVVPPDVWDLCKWASQYYHQPWGEILNCAIPAASLGLRSARRVARKVAPREFAPMQIKTLTSAQSEVCRGIEDYFLNSRDKDRVALLHGVTGSGKTEIYLQLARDLLAQGKTILVLVPEIALTPQLRDRFESGLGQKVAQWHSALPDGQRRDLSSALRAGEIRVVVGARSAVFAPLENLGLIIVDEEHDSTYKQEDRVRYHARDLAIVRGRFSNTPILLGSATPSYESLERALDGKYRYFELSERAIVGAHLPSIEIVDLTQEPRVEGLQAALAERTLEAIRETIARGEKAMVFLNRRGFASFLVCEECGEVNSCTHCSISLTVHQRAGLLKCHFCGHAEEMPLSCGKCAGTRLQPIGAGTESLEQQLPALLPEAKIARLDRDQITSVTRLEEVLDDFRNGEKNLLLGTQMLVKGHDFPEVTLVVVVLADGLFRWPDFRSDERAFQVLTQVAGRAGRAAAPGRVMIQTYSPSQPVLQAVVEQRNAKDWYLGEREMRNALQYPPFARLARLRVQSPDRNRAKVLARQVADALLGLGSFQNNAVTLLGPTEAAVEKLKDIYRWDMLVKSSVTRELHEALEKVREAAFLIKAPDVILIDVDPSGMG